MHVYRFKITFENDDDFMRELELKSNHTFYDFHKVITANLGLGDNTLSSFFIADSRFRKKREISLIDMSPEDAPEPMEGEDAPEPMVEMKNAVLRDFIDDPHQKLVYVYDYLNYWTFYLELLKISPAKLDVEYPRFVKSTGDTPSDLLPKGGKIDSGSSGSEFANEEQSFGLEDLASFDEESGFFDEEGDSLDDFSEDKF